MTIIATQNFDGGTNGSNITVSSPWTYQLGASGVSSTFATAAAAHGALGMRITDCNHQNDIRYDNASPIASFCLSFYFNIRTFPGAALFMGATNDNSNVKVCDWRINTAGTVAIRNSSSSAVATSTPTVTTATWYRAEHLVTASSQELKIFTGEGTTPLIDISGATGTTNTVRYGFSGPIAAASATGAIDIDTIRIADTWTGPFANSGYVAQYKLAAGTWQNCTINRVS